MGLDCDALAHGRVSGDALALGAAQAMAATEAGQSYPTYTDWKRLTEQELLTARRSGRRAFPHTGWECEKDDAN